MRKLLQWFWPDPAGMRRYVLVLLLFVVGGGGIFSEENGGRQAVISDGFAGNRSLFIARRQKDFVVFCPVDYLSAQNRKKNKGFIRSAFPPVSIMGKGKLTVGALAAFLHNNNPNVPLTRAKKIARIYMQEAKAEGVNYDIAFSQMCLETGFLRFGGSVLPGQYNFCGLGVLNQKTRGFSFGDIRLGIRAHIQHLKAYASRQTLRKTLVDPRFRFVRRGSIRTIDGLSGQWASDKNYGKKIRFLLLRMYREKV